MRASTTYPSNGSKVTKIAIVTLLHLGVALALISMKVPGKETAAKDHIDVFLKDELVIEEHETMKADTKQAAPDLPVITTTIDIEQQEALPFAPLVPLGLPKADTNVIPGGTDHGGGNAPAPVETKKEKVHMAALANAGDCARPDYPANAARNGDTGTVSLALLIGVDGKVSEAKVKQSSGFKDLDRAAVAALSMCKFKPATTNGVAEPAWGQIAYVWSLD